MVRVVQKRALVLTLVLGSLLLTFYYASKKVLTTPEVTRALPERPVHLRNVTNPGVMLDRTKKTRRKYETCPANGISRARASIETVDIFPTLNFDAEWMDRREYWNDKMEKRYKKRRQEMWEKVPLKVFVMPHSHNDPGWLKTYESYFHSATKIILDNIVDKLTKYKDMTFIWTEISFLSLWYETAHDARKANLLQLVDEGRFEILTGGWVMTDEANVDLFGMVDQLIEGHQWLHNYLNTTVKSSWSVDPFGHGGTFPYVLKSAGLSGMVIMRIHYAWKEWFAKEQNGDFLWHQQWDHTGKHDMLCLNFPYDIYSIKGSCGPHPQTCLEFNFRKVDGDFSEYTARYTPIHPQNLKERAELLLEQYGKTGSLFPHNVVLAPLGDDFTYNHDIEFDQQYANYKMLMDFINQGDYNAHVEFGTLSDYFEEVKKRMSNFETLNGDFFVYSDIFSEGRPAYWSGYFTTRPFMKQLARELQGLLRTTEILYTYGYNYARQKSDSSATKYLESAFGMLTDARRSLALFQHHDAITGTSKQAVMHDYGLKLYDGIVNARKIVKSVFRNLMEVNTNQESQTPTLSEDFQRLNYQSQPLPLPLDLKHGNDKSFVMVFNSLAHVVHEVVSVFLEKTDVCVEDPEGNLVDYQLSPTWNSSGFFRLDMAFVELTFVAKLPPLAISKYTIRRCDVDNQQREKTDIYCLRCPKKPDSATNPFRLGPMPTGSIQLENSEMMLQFDEDTRLLTNITNKRSGTTENVQLQFSAYSTDQFRSGAYLFRTNEGNIEVFGQKDLREVVVISGPVFSEVTLVFESGMSKSDPGSFVHTVRLYHTKDGVRNKAVYIENDFDFGGSENHNDVDLFMRFKSEGIKNADEFYTDMNGLQMQKRKLVRKINIEGNYYPVTTMTYIEDAFTRLTLVVDHAQGAASWNEGWLEVMVDRRSTFDDARGMGEGVFDNKQTKHKYWLLLEEPKFDSTSTSSMLSYPSEVANTLSRYLNYPSIHFVGPDPASFKSHHALLSPKSSQLPCDIHLFNLRTLSKPETPTLPSNEALVLWHRQTGDCVWNSLARCDKSKTMLTFDLHGVEVTKLRKTSLTGVIENESVGSMSEINVDPFTIEAVKMTF